MSLLPKDPQKLRFKHRLFRITNWRCHKNRQTSVNETPSFPQLKKSLDFCFTAPPTKNAVTKKNKHTADTADVSSFEDSLSNEKNSCIGRVERLVQILRGTSFLLGVPNAHGPTTLWVPWTWGPLKAGRVVGKNDDVCGVCCLYLTLHLVSSWCWNNTFTCFFWFLWFSPLFNIADIAYLRIYSIAYFAYLCLMSWRK